MTGLLQDKVCIVTGAGGSISRASALRFAKEGAKLIICDIDAESNRETRDLVAADGGEVVAFDLCDLTSLEDCKKLIDLSVTKWERVDVLFNNAAIAYFGWISELSIEDWRKTINEELDLLFYLTQAAWPPLRKGGGSIINTASASAWTT